MYINDLRLLIGIIKSHVLILGNISTINQGEFLYRKTPF